MTKNHHNDVKSSSKADNFQFFAEGGNYIPVNRWFFDARTQGQLTNQEFLIAVLFFEWSFSKYKISTFEISRAELSKIAAVGEKQAHNTLQILVKNGVLKVVTKDRTRGGKNIYRWNANLLKTQVGVYLTDTAPVSQGYGPLYPTDTAPVSQGYGLYIEYILKIIKISNNKYFGAPSHDVDNQNFDDEGGESKADSVESSISDLGTKRLAAWKVAIATCGQGKHETKFWQIFNFVSYYQIPFEEVRDPLRWLVAIAKDNSTFYEINKRSLFPFTNDDEFQEFIIKNQGGTNESIGSTGEISTDAQERRNEVQASTGEGQSSTESCSNQAH